MSKFDSNAPRVAVTGYMAHFGGPNRRAWRWRFASHRSQETSLRLAMGSARQNFAPARFRQKNHRGLTSSLTTALEEWRLFPVTKKGINPERAAVVFSSSKGNLFWLEHHWRRFQAGRV